MGTKNEPGKWNCYANAADDEPVFVLLGRDPAAASCIALWRALRAAIGEEPMGSPKSVEADQCARAMQAYATARGKGEQVRGAGLAVAMITEGGSLLAASVNHTDALQALAPLVAIADAYDDDGLDEARPEWGAVKAEPKPEDVELFSGRGGRELLTLAHCLAARRVVRGG